jgi:hypothetical protein
MAFFPRSQALFYQMLLLQKEMLRLLQLAILRILWLIFLLIVRWLLLQRCVKFDFCIMMFDV